MKKVKKFMTHRREAVIETTVLFVVSVACYTYVCGKAGYRMSRPTGFDADGQPTFESLTGRAMHVKISK